MYDELTEVDLRKMQEEIDYLQSDEYIDAWAQQNGMVRGE